MKLVELINSREALNEILETGILAKTAFKISLVIDRINPILIKFEETRNNLIKSMGKVDKDGNIGVTEENIPKFLTELNEITDTEMDDLSITKIKIDTLGDAVIKPKIFLVLKWLFEE